MVDEEDPVCITDDISSSFKFVPSFISGGKRDDIEYFRMDSPSQLENEYVVGKKLGEGTFGVVNSGIRKRDNTKCAIKKILREKNYSISERVRLNREISILRFVRHPSIIELYAVAESPSYLFLITELCEGDTLSYYLDSSSGRDGFDESIVIEIIRQVASAVSYLHNRGIIHRDLKAGNIMLLYKVDLFSRKPPRPTTSASHRDSGLRVSSSTCGVFMNTKQTVKKQLSPRCSPLLIEHDQQAANKDRSNHQKPPQFNSSPLPIDTLKGTLPRVVSTTGTRTSMYRNSLKSALVACPIRVKLIDFGLAIEVRKNEEILDNPCGTPLYMAPEVLHGKSYTRQCDVWSLGILMFQLLTGHFPISAQNETKLIELMNAFDVKMATERFSHLSELAENCLYRVLHSDPAYRYSAAELLLDPWITQFDTISSLLNETQQVNDDEVPTPRNTLPDGSTNMSRPASIVTDASNISMNLRSSFSGRQISGIYSSTNVLELMKQYHKELVTNKQDTNDSESKSSEA